LLTNPSDDSAFLRVVNVPKREIGATTLEKLGRMAQARHSSLLGATRSDSVLHQLTPRPAAALAAFANLLDELRSASLHQNAADLVDTILQRTGYGAHIIAGTSDAALRERRLGNVKELADWFRAMQKYGTSAGDLASQLALLSHADRDDPGNAVR